MDLAKGNHAKMPEMLERGFDIEVQDAAGQWTTVAQVTNNYQRLVRIPLDATTTGLRFTARTSWGAEKVHLYAFDVR